MFILGIVGSPAGGKSTVAARLQEHGAVWINADRVAREVMEDPDIQQELSSHFGDEVVDSAGQVDRGKIASLVFGDDDASRRALKYLEGLIHPRTRLRITDRLRNCANDGVTAAILDVPLLFKSGWDQSCDEIWCVDSDRNIRMDRARDRGWDDGELARREANQIDIRTKKQLSNHVIVNDGTLNELHQTVDRLWNSFLQRNNKEAKAATPHCLKNLT